MCLKNKLSVILCTGMFSLPKRISSWLTERSIKDGLPPTPLAPSISSPSSPYLCQAWFTVRQSAPAGRPLQDVTS